MSTPLGPSAVSTRKVALLLFGSGMCALIYQMAWLREFRLIFGASTAASAAVLAIFMAGLGLGSLVLGGRADRQARPLAFYANLELAIALSAALTPLIMMAVRAAYFATGGSSVLGLWGATGVRLLLAALVLLVPTFLMGGTLPAAARSVENDDDLGRRNLGFLYGLNTLGAVTGTLLATFFLLETFGTRRTLWAACLVNALIALVARNLAKPAEDGEPSPAPADPEAGARPATERPATTPVLSMGAGDGPAVPASFVLAAAAVVGFAFLLMELVWYRILSPILGGSTFTFGLILAVALLGIGLGGAAYSVFRGNKAVTLNGFALTCALEAFFIAVPFALGDRVALVAMLLRDMASIGFLGLVGGWALITILAVMPAAFISGIQFPMLIALLGQGRRSVGRHVGLAYAYNTVGAIVGSLAGGFGLLPLLTAPGTWRLVVVLLALLSLAALALAFRAATRQRAESETGGADGTAMYAAWPAALAALLAAAMLFATGPTAAWRHGGIGAGRSDRFDSSPNSLRAFVNNHRRMFFWEQEGVESSVGVDNNSGFAFYVNGKCDGHIRDDAGTQIMAGLTGAILHGSPRTAMVIGLGTGSTAGWMGAAPTMERVDVVELEPAVLQVARLCADGNRDVLHNPKVHVTIGDAREALLTSRKNFDLVFSEPSNPYRAGVASLYTHEFYQAVRDKLQPGGLFLQWVQAYEIDGQTLRTVYATCHSVFPYLETWQTQGGDLLLVGSPEPFKHDAAALRARVAEEPYRTALASVWRVTSLEGFLARHIGNADFAADVAKAHGEPLNTDDRTVVEFGFARSVGTKGSINPGELMRLAQTRRQERPAVSGDVDWEAVEDERVAMNVYEGRQVTVPAEAPDHRRKRAQSMNFLLQGNAAAAVQTWKQQPREPSTFAELTYMANALSEGGNADAEKYIEQIRPVQETEAYALLANLRWRQRRPGDAVTALHTALTRYRTDPWPQRDLMRRTIALAYAVASGDQLGQAARVLHEAMSTPFSLSLNEDARRRALVLISGHLDRVTGSTLLPDAIGKFEPFVPWEEQFLQLRVDAYARANHPNLRQAKEDLEAFQENKPFPFDFELQPTPAPTTGPATGPTTAPGAAPSLGPILGSPQGGPSLGNAPPSGAAGAAGAPPAPGAGEEPSERSLGR